MRITQTALGILLVVILMPAHAALGATGFSFADVMREARWFSQHPYKPPPQVPRFLANISYGQYQAIRFNPAKSLWSGAGRNFQVQPVPPGLYYTSLVSLMVVKNGAVHPLHFPKSDFAYPSTALSARLPDNPGVAGFKLTYPLSGPGIRNQFLVFAGASYFRAVGRGNNFGLSARAIAINTAFPPDEEFPAFRKFWLVEPQRGACSILVYALLDGPSVSGAYRFLITPGNATRMEVRAVLFFRKTPRVTGIAPLTSMFFYGDGTPRPSGEWRPAVHDSDGLQIENGDGEWLWRPLINPAHFLVSSFTLDNPRGFGLMQREERFSAYEDLGARYDLRPSAWIVPDGKWGRGQLELVEIPAESETEDNIVAYWVPAAPPVPGREYRYAYTLLFGRAGVSRPPAAYVEDSFVGSGHDPGAACNSQENSLRFVVDFGGKFPQSASRAEGVVSAGGNAQVNQVSVARNTVSGGYRLAFLVKPEPGHPLELRAFLRHGQNTLSETWSYLLPWDNARALFATPACPASRAAPGMPISR